MTRRWAMVWALCVSTSVWAADWPQWLGPDRTGKSAETGLVDGFKKGTTELWRRSIGAGYASVAVANGLVYAMVREEGRQLARAFDAATGTPRWSVDVGPAFEDVQGFHGPRVTPTVVDDKVVVMHPAGRLLVLQASNGAVAWETNVATDLGGNMPRFGYAGSPLVDDGKLYLSTGAREGKALLALSLEDGAVVWRSGSFAAGYSSPIRATLGGADVIVFFTGYGPVGADPKTGAIRWKYRWKTDYEINAATPVVLGSNRLFVASGYGVGGAALLIDEQANVSELWRTKRMKNKLATSVLHDGYLYGFNETRLTAIRAKDGEEMWSDGSYGRGSLAVAEDHLFVVSENCTFSVVKATPKGHKVVGEPIRPLTAEPCWTMPVIANGVVYLRDGAELLALELRSLGPAAPAPR